MKFKETFYLACVLLVIAAYYFGIEKPAEKEDILKQEKNSNVLTFKKEAVQKIELKNRNASILLEKTKSSDWSMLRPVLAKGDTDAISSFLSGMGSLKFFRIVDESPKDTSIFGLNNPYLTVTIFLEENFKKTVNFGDIHPMGSGTYLSTSESDRVLLSINPREFFEKTVFDLRDKSVLNFNDKKLEKIKIDRDGKVLQLEKVEADWHLIQKTKSKVDSSAIQHLINNLSFQKVKRFIDDAKELPVETAWKNPYLTITLELQGAGEPILLLVGEKYGEQGRYARTNLSDQVFVLSFSDIADLDLDAVNLLDRTLISVPASSISQIELQDSESTIRLDRGIGEKNVWKIVSPIETGVDSTAINSLLADLREARIVKFAQTTVEDPIPFGLDRPSKKMRIRSGTEDWTLELGNQSPDKEMYFARRSGEMSVFNIRTTLADKLFRSLHSLRDKKILHFDTDSVHRIRWKFPAQTLELVKSGKFWTLVKPEKIENIKSFLGNEVLWTLKTVEFESILESPSDSEITWSTSPEVTVEIWDDKDHSIAILKMGGPEDDRGRILAQVNGDPKIYRVARRFLEEIPNQDDKFK